MVEPQLEEVYRLLFFLRGRDPQPERLRAVFDLRPCRLPPGAGLRETVGTIFEGMLGYLRVESRPQLRIEEQKPGLAAHGQNQTWVVGTYEPLQKRITVYVPPVLHEPSLAQLAGTLAHEITHHHLHTNLRLSISDYLGGITLGSTLNVQRNEVLTDLATVWLGFGPLLIEARRTFATAYQRGGLTGCSGYVTPPLLEEAERFRKVLQHKPRPVLDWLKSSASGQVPDCPVLTKLEDGALHMVVVDTIQSSEIVAYGSDGSEKRFRRSELRWLNGDVEPLTPEIWVQLPPDERSGKIVRLVDGSVGEFEILEPNRADFHDFRTKARRPHDVNILRRNAGARPSPGSPD